MAKREPAPRVIVDISALKALTREERIRLLTSLINGRSESFAPRHSPWPKRGKSEQKH